MAVRSNTTLRNTQVSATASAFDGGSLAIYTGSQPASADDAASGTLLGTITIPATAFGAASSGVVQKAGTWSTTAVATGTAGWARMTGGSNVLDMDIGEGSGTLSLNETSVVTGGSITVSSLSITQPAS